jgi:hypothetical protein
MRFGWELEERRIFSSPIEGHRGQERRICGASNESSGERRNHMHALNFLLLIWPLTSLHLPRYACESFSCVAYVHTKEHTTNTQQESGNIGRGTRAEDSGLALLLSFPSVSRRLLLLALCLWRKGQQKKSDQTQGNVCHRSVYIYGVRNVEQAFPLISMNIYFSCTIFYDTWTLLVAICLFMDI